MMLVSYVSRIIVNYSYGKNVLERSQKLGLCDEARKGIMTKDSHPDADNRLLSDSVLFMLSPRSQRELPPSF
jgi:hypothetical protein